ncbi:protein ALP1-like [Phalaenopsis equestris]|uniref:protein ALP1-like n=1 Tax=Phalaenopsis equestris TaxID=78828 RepID=UPI0009E54BC7|nr:protein ALP1-like [Phalaenopsis equestris]
MHSRPAMASVMSGPKISSSDTTGSTKSRKPTQEEEEERGQFAHDDLTPTLSLAASAISLSLLFLSDGSRGDFSGDLLLLPSQALTLESSVHSAAASLARLLTLLRRSPKTLTLNCPSPTTSLSPRPSWFIRFLSSSPYQGDQRWLENFRMSKPSFYFLLQTLAPSLNSSASAAPSGVVSIPPEHKLGAALFHLAHAAPFRSVARRFGLPSPDLACRAFYEVCKAVADQLGHLFELSSDLNRVLQGFHWMSLPNCCGSLGFSCFCSSVIAQALVDTEGRFLDVSVGWRASMHPAEILPRTKLHSSQAIVLACGPPLQLNGVGSSIPRYFLGGSCCALLPWLLTPFSAADELSGATAAVYNAVHARGMELVRKAFARLRARWQLLRGAWNDECAQALPFVIVSACLLHNYLIKCSEPVPEESELGKEVADGFPEFEGKGDKAGERIRCVLASHLSKVINP